MKTIKLGRSFLTILFGIVALAQNQEACAMALVPGDIYSSNYFSDTINHYDAGGVYIDSMTLASSYGSEVKGLAFNQGMLYAITTTGSGFGVLTIDSSNSINEVASGSTYIAGNLSFGKISFATNGQFFVSGQNGLTSFTPGFSTGSVIYSNNQVFDSVALPSGNLLVLSAYDIQEITTSGTVVRTISLSSPDNLWLVDARGIEYDAKNNKIYVTMLGYSGVINENFRLMKIDGATGNVEINSSFWYGDDMVLTADNRLIVGSRTQAPGIFDLNLNQVGTLSAGQQMFVAQMPVPIPSTVALLFSGMTALFAFVRRR